jgi:hydrogenase nickel incorporation protein HypB
MCGTCGCSDENSVTIRKPGEENSIHQHEHDHGDGLVHSHSHDHSDEHGHGQSHNHIHEDNHVHSHDHSDGLSQNHDHDHSHALEIKIEQDILHKNDKLAERNRGYFEAKNILSMNMVSSPGSGKTSLLEKTIKDNNGALDFFIIEGDQQTMNDAERIKAAGAPVVQINTGQGCHLDADMVNRAVKALKVNDNSVLFIENVGNLVCPAMFDLGESKRVVVISVTEGEDKPIKYPAMFSTSDICIINKIDLLPYLDFDVEKLRNYALQVNHHLEFIELSVKTGEGIEKWYEWLKNTSTKNQSKS